MSNTSKALRFRKAIVKSCGGRQDDRNKLGEKYRKRKDTAIFLMGIGDYKILENT